MITPKDLMVGRIVTDFQYEYLIDEATLVLDNGLTIVFRSSEWLTVECPEFEEFQKSEDVRLQNENLQRKLQEDEEFRKQGLI